MDAVHFLTLRTRSLAICAAISLVFTLQVRAQAGVLEFNTPVQSSLDAGESESWTFNASEGQALSFSVESSGALDPVLTISSSSGAELLRNDDYNYPESRDSLIEALTITRTGTYTATVTALGETSGDYTLTMQPGFADLALGDSLDDRRDWESSGAPLTFQVSSGQAALELATGQERGLALRTDDFPAEMYAQARVVDVRGQPGWIVGLITRYRDSRTYYALSINQDGQWRFSVNTSAGETVLRDWITHPAIGPGSPAFTLGVLSSGSGFEFFYNGVLIGRVTDVDHTITDGGQIGFLIETSGSTTSRVNAQFDDLLVTVPRRVNGQPIVPDRVVVADSRAIVPQLQRRHLVPYTGQMILTVPESFATYNRPGVYEVPLAAGQSFGRLAIGTTVSWTAEGSGAVGCGLLLHTTGENDYTLAYLDQTGGYGVSRRRGDTFEPGIFGQMPLNTSDSHHLLVIVSADMLVYYVDGFFAGRMPTPSGDEAGSVGNAVVNFEPVNTSCEFRDTWVWRWD